MTLFKTSAWNAIAVVLRVLTALGLNKILALYVGPSGYAVIGQFQNFISMLTTFASGAINTGVTKYTAEYHADEAQQHRLWRTAGTIAACGCVVASFLIITLRHRLAFWLLNDDTFSSIFLWLGLSLGLYVLNALLLAILNGKKDIRRYVMASIAGSIVGILVTGGLAAAWGLYGALVALAVNQSIVALVTLSLCYRATWFRIGYLWGRIDHAKTRNLAKYAMMALTTAAVVPVSQILIRNHLIQEFGWESAGHWQAMTKISELYLLLLTSTLSLYYLPRLSEIRAADELKAEIIKGYRFILPMAVAGALSLNILRDFITVTLFATSFAPMKDLFPWQLSGDVLKIGSWLLAFVMLAHSMTRAYIITEILFSALQVLLVITATSIYGLRGAPMAYCLCYALYWITMFGVITRHLKTLSGNAENVGERPN